MVNNDGEVVMDGDCPTPDNDSEMDSGSEVVSAKSALGTGGLGRDVVFYSDSGHSRGKLDPSGASGATGAQTPTQQSSLKRSPPAASLAILVADVEQEFKTLWGRNRMFCTVPVQK